MASFQYVDQMLWGATGQLAIEYLFLRNKFGTSHLTKEHVTRTCAKRIKQEKKMKKKLSILEHKDHAFTPVPQCEKQTIRKMLFVWLGFVLSATNLMCGALVGGLLGLKQGIIAIVIGNLILALVSIGTSRIGSQTGLSTHVITRYSFGTKGSKLPSLLFAFAQIGWFGVVAGSAGDAIATPLGLNVTVVTLIISILMMSTAVLGFKALQKLSNVAVPLVILFCLVGLGLVFAGNGTQFIDMATSVGTGTPITVGISIVVAFWIPAAICSSDITRFAKTPLDATKASAIGILIGNVLLMSCGAIFSVAVGLPLEENYNIAKMVYGIGLPVIIGALFILLVQWTTADNNLYTSGLGLANVFENDNKKLLTFIGGSVGTFMATAGIYNKFVDWLTFLGTFVPPLAGVILVDYYLFGEKYQKKHDGLKNTVSIPAMTAWAIGSFVAFKTSFGIQVLNGVVAAAVSYYIIAKVLEYRAKTVATDKVG